MNEKENCLSFREVYFPLEEMTARIREICTQYGLKETEKALSFSLERHEGQYRKRNLYSSRNIPYIIHPLTMACHAAETCIRDDAVLASILLHDTAEDTGISAGDLPFHDEIKEIVSLLTFEELPGESRSSAKKRYYAAMKENPKACLVKLFDRCSNLSTMAGSFSRGRMAEYIQEAEEYILPLAETVLREMPGYAPQIFLLRYQIFSLTDTIKYMLERGME